MGDKSGSRWTFEQVDILLKLVREGYSASLIAEQLGKTRSAVLGKKHRMGASNSRETALQPIYKKGGNGPPGKRGHPSPRPERVPTAQPKRVKPPKPDLVKPEPFDPKKYFLLENLLENQCKWPVNDPPPGRFLFCGQRKIGASVYCQTHADMHASRQQPGEWWK
jgi:GcrA cell cycle regulator